MSTAPVQPGTPDDGRGPWPERPHKTAGPARSGLSQMASMTIGRGHLRVRRRKPLYPAPSLQPRHPVWNITRRPAPGWNERPGYLTLAPHHRGLQRRWHASQPNSPSHECRT